MHLNSSAAGHQSRAQVQAVWIKQATIRPLLPFPDEAKLQVLFPAVGFWLVHRTQTIAASV